MHRGRLLAETGQCLCSVLRVVSGCKKFYDIRIKKLYSLIDVGNGIKRVIPLFRASSLCHVIACVTLDGTKID